mmetsp:Transcript_16111/g.26056  ORF Transcript_16111/g.26056 Transcript_16111/m.26056 type:complete len:234 (+) Transcript_16111:1020-1721(+)
MDRKRRRAHYGGNNGRHGYSLSPLVANLTTTRSSPPPPPPLTTVHPHCSNAKEDIPPPEPIRHTPQTIHTSWPLNEDTPCISICTPFDPSLLDDCDDARYSAGSVMWRGDRLDLMFGRRFEGSRWNTCVLMMMTVMMMMMMMMNAEVGHNPVTMMMGDTESCILLRGRTIPSFWNDRWNLSESRKCRLGRRRRRNDYSLAMASMASLDHHQHDENDPRFAYPILLPTFDRPVP